MITGDMVAVRLTPSFRAIMVAAPSYLNRAPPLRRIADLKSHNCIGYRLQSSAALYAWELLQRGKDVAVDVRGTTCVTDLLFALDLALAGIGIAYLFEPLARTHLDFGALHTALPTTAIEEPGLFLYFQKRAAEAPKLRALINLARKRSETR